jgi:hypothetical protein
MQFIHNLNNAGQTPPFTSRERASAPFALLANLSKFSKTFARGLAAICIDAQTLPVIPARSKNRQE